MKKVIIMLNREDANEILKMDHCSRHVVLGGEIEMDEYGRAKIQLVTEKIEDE